MTASEPEQVCRYTFKVGNYDPDAFDYARSAEVAGIYLRQFGHALVTEPVFESAEPVPGSYKPATGGMALVTFVAPCRSNHRAPTLAESNDPQVPY